MMSPTLTLAGWVLAGVLALIAVRGWVTTGSRMESVSRACHELRGPLAAVRLGLELVRRTGDLSSDRLEAIDLELDQATQALDDLTSALRQEWAAHRRSMVDIRKLLLDSVQAWNPAASQSGVELELRWPREPAWVRGDRTRLGQAIGNLLANAIEHGGGNVEVRSAVNRSRVRIEVIDGGIGLPAPVATLARRAQRGRGEHGRGLAIAIEIARAHGGRLAAAPTDRGARLVLELPKADDPATTPAR